MRTKICSVCSVEKPVGDFFSRKESKDGFRNECKVCRRIKIKEYRATDSGKEMRKREYKSNRDKYIESARKRYFEKRKEILAYMSGYFKTEKGKANARRSWHKRRSLEKGLPATLTEGEWQEILVAQNFKCKKCGLELPLERDHIVPLSKGGEYTKENIQGLCKSCNCKKNNKLEVCYASC